MAGIIGTGSLTVRTTTRVASTEVKVEGPIVEIGSGILVLGDLAYTLPVQPGLRRRSGRGHTKDGGM